MKIPKTLMRFCKKCKKHTEQKVSMSKKRTAGSAHPLSRWAKTRTNFGHGTGNLGKYGSKPAVTKFKRTGAKGTKKTDLRYTCSVCKKSSPQREGIRAKKVELV